MSSRVEASPATAASRVDLDAPAPPWGHNPSAWSQRIPICVLAGVATLVSAYLGLYQWGLVDHVWDPFFGDQSERVLDSAVSERMRAWIGVPDAILGAIAYPRRPGLRPGGLDAPLAVDHGWCCSSAWTSSRSES